MKTLGRPDCYGVDCSLRKITEEISTHGIQLKTRDLNAGAQLKVGRLKRWYNS